MDQQLFSEFESIKIIGQAQYFLHTIDLSNMSTSQCCVYEPLILINVKNCYFVTMCKAHSKVTHIKQQQYFLT